MSSAKRWCLFLVAIAILVASQRVNSEERTWADASGKFSIEAEFVRLEGEQVVLLKSDGKELKVPLAKLSEADQAFVEQQMEGDQAAMELIALTEAFYEDLRTEEREVASEMLTADALEIIADGASPLKVLPTPDEGSRSLRAGRAKIDGDAAEVPMRVKTGGKMHKTKLHFRTDEDAWRVFAISATFTDGEKTLIFEASASTSQGGNLLEQLVGTEAELAGYTPTGKKFDLAEYEGKVVLIDFWATWSGPCRAEIPNIQENWDQYHDDGFEVVAVSIDRDLAKLKEFVAEEEPPWTVLADRHTKNKTSMAAQYGVSGIPAFVLVGPAGEVVAVNCRGRLLGEELAKLLGPAAEKDSEPDAPIESNEPAEQLNLPAAK